MSHIISDWDVIAHDFVDGNGALLIGNGASRAVDSVLDMIHYLIMPKLKILWFLMYMNYLNFLILKILN